MIIQITIYDTITLSHITSLFSHFIIFHFNLIFYLGLSSIVPAIYLTSNPRQSVQCGSNPLSPCPVRRWIFGEYLSPKRYVLVKIRIYRNCEISWILNSIHIHTYRIYKEMVIWRFRFHSPSVCWMYRKLFPGVTPLQTEE